MPEDDKYTMRCQKSHFGLTENLNSWYREVRVIVDFPTVMDFFSAEGVLFTEWKSEMENLASLKYFDPDEFM